MRTRKRCPAHPGRILRNLYLTPLGISNTKIAAILGVSRNAVSNIVNEHKSVTPEMALRLSRLFGNSAEFWLNAQRAVDLWDAAQAIGAEVKRIKPLAVS